MRSEKVSTLRLYDKGALRWNAIGPSPSVAVFNNVDVVYCIRQPLSILNIRIPMP